MKNYFLKSAFVSEGESEPAPGIHHFGDNHPNCHVDIELECDVIPAPINDLYGRHMHFEFGERSL